MEKVSVDAVGETSRTVTGIYAVLVGLAERTTLELGKMYLRIRTHRHIRPNRVGEEVFYQTRPSLSLRLVLRHRARPAYRPKRADGLWQGRAYPYWVLQPGFLGAAAG